MKNIYIISDVHGCYKTLLALIDQFLNKQKSKIVFVGDLIDKGKNTYDVIEFVKNNNYDCVIGNHDEMMVLYSQYLENDRQHEDLKYWLFKCGGEATLNSYSSQEKFYEHIIFKLNNIYCKQHSLNKISSFVFILIIFWQIYK